MYHDILCFRLLIGNYLYIQEQPAKLLPQHHHLVLVNGFAGANCPNGSFTLESPIYNGTVSEPIFVLPNVPSSELSNFGATFTSNCTGQSYKVKASFKLPENNSLVLYIDENSLLDGGNGLKNESSIIYPNMLSKPEKGGALFFTLHNLANSTNYFHYFACSEASGKLVPHALRISGSTVLGYLEPFEVETNGQDFIIGFGYRFRSKRFTTPLTMKQGATYVLLVTGDLKKVNASFNVETINY